MQTYVVYESMFGHTQEVARAVAAGLATWSDVEVVEVGDAPALDALRADLVVVGAPTHAFGLSRQQTRRDAVEQGGPVISDARAVRDWISSRSAVDLRVATFDTSVPPYSRLGNAARSAARLLQRRGCTLAGPPTSFRVEGVNGPLQPGELERAREWGESLAGRLQQAPA